MLDPKMFDEMAKKFSDTLPSGLRGFQDDFEKHVRATMQSIFERLDLVTREEFDVQTKVLERTRMKLEALEATVAKLEASQNPVEPQE